MDVEIGLVSHEYPLFIPAPNSISTRFPSRGSDQLGGMWPPGIVSVEVDVALETPGTRYRVLALVKRNDHKSSVQGVSLFLPSGNLPHSIHRSVPPQALKVTFDQ